MASLEQIVDLNNTSFEDITRRLKVYEERISEEEEAQDDQRKLMYTESQSACEYSGEYKTRGRGRYNSGRDTSKVVCYICDKTGQYASDCPDRLLKLQEAQENDKKSTIEADELMIHEVVYLNEEKVIPSKYETNTEEDNVLYLENELVTT